MQLKYTLVSLDLVQTEFLEFCVHMFQSQYTPYATIYTSADPLVVLRSKITHLRLK